MPIVRRSRADLIEAPLKASLATGGWPESEIDAMAVDDAAGWTDADIATAIRVYPPVTPDQVKALRTRLGLSQVQFALRFGFTIDAIQQYEQGHSTPSGAASTLLRVIETDPDAVLRALHRR